MHASKRKAASHEPSQSNVQNFVAPAIRIRSKRVHGHKAFCFYGKAAFQEARCVIESFEWLVQLNDAWGKPGQAGEWKKKPAEFELAAKASDNKAKTP